MKSINTKSRYHPHIHHRQSIRLKGYDYSSAGAYYVTVCTFRRQQLLGEVADGEMVTNELGRIVEQTWMKLPEHFQYVTLDEFVVMPNHVHGIVFINEGRGDALNVIEGARLSDLNASPLRPHGTQRGSLGAIVQNVKSVASRRINRLRRMPGAPLWQRNYYEHVVRNENELDRIRRYVVGNPAKWDEDEYNPRYVYRADASAGASHCINRAARGLPRPTPCTAPGGDNAKSGIV